ncbi:hexokinase [Gregarina niphandrodes]|uniref:Phosphotransferase n=1 Tax=Gregarina niphandrodes TaxID=110365 RepID=A0A023BBG8_GRENI|nr:hexokinase [Gregarina niphandrodes]EZG79345.1 hexokinase [Gregarina niphandrodes]|eukprot:XP_011129065.1 hexokinase [Gregarina niphandrodes]
MATSGSGEASRAEDIVNAIRMGENDCQAVYNEVSVQIVKGLMMHREDPDKVDFAKSDFMMLDTGVKHTPTGEELGVYYGLDMGGSNVRAMRVTFDGSGMVQATTEEKVSLAEVPYAADLPRGVFDRMATASQLFDGVVWAVKRLMQRHDELGTTKPVVDVGFTCSFGIQQKTIDKAVLTQWSKGFETGTGTNDPVVGQDVGAMVNEAFHRQNINAKVNCILNDTLSTLISGNLNHDGPPCQVGAIVGTGFNVCYFEKDAPLFNYGGNVVNTECGGLAHSLPRVSADSQVDFNSSNPGHQVCEKMVSGLYLGECIRYMMIDILQDHAPPSLWVKNSLLTADAAKIFNAPAADKTQVAGWFQREPSDTELHTLKDIVDAVFTRSARLVGCVLAAFATRTMTGLKLDRLTVGVDGSLYVLNPKYQNLVAETIQEQLSMPHILLTSATGGSCTGAALLSACTKAGTN